MDRLQRIFQGSQGGAGMGGAAGDSPQVDTSEQIYISSLALLKMLKHGVLTFPSVCWSGAVLCCSSGLHHSMSALWQGVRACRWRSWA